ncbi:elongation factor P [Candidatus Saccharibacteria bacterium CG10_big_fil_rev_8_21_14_0_10_47_8]|nr:MAG: elongation factor P [Candidatus Saccharibacteria bacterium CG10_big_fil_rev_8_21_14_0_10_47_8]
MALSITNLKKGTIFQLDGVPYRVLDYSQKVMGRGGSTVKVKIKSLIDGKVLPKTFHGSDQVDSADVASRSVQYLYADDANYYFMGSDSYEQFSVPAADIADQAGYLKEGSPATAQLFDGRVIGIELPKNVALFVKYTENAVKGDTSSAIQKDATLETGLVIRVPAFIKSGDIVSVDTGTGTYRGRQK